MSLTEAIRSKVVSKEHTHTRFLLYGPVIGITLGNQITRIHLLSKFAKAFRIKREKTSRQEQIGNLKQQRKKKYNLKMPFMFYTFL